MTGYNYNLSYGLRRELFRPRYIWVPFGKNLSTFNQTVVNMIINGQTGRVADTTDEIIWGHENNYKGGMGAFAHNSQWGRVARGPLQIFIRTADIYMFDLSGYDPNPRTYGPGYNSELDRGTYPFANSGQMTTAGDNLNYFESIQVTTSNFLIDVDNVNTMEQAFMVDRSASYGGPYSAAYAFQGEDSYGFFTDASRYTTGDGSQFGDIAMTYHAYRQLGSAMATTDAITWIQYDITTKEFIVTNNTSDWIEPNSSDFTICGTSRGTFSVNLIGDDFWKVNHCWNAMLGTGTEGFTGARQSGTIAHKAVFPDKNVDNTPLRYVSFYRPNIGGATSSTPTATPLAAHSGFTFTVASDDYTERCALDPNSGTQPSVNLLFGDRTLVEMGGGSTTESLDARRLKLPGPLIEDTLHVTKPWNNEVLQFDRAHGSFDFHVGTDNMLDWKVKIAGKNSSATATVMSSITPGAPSLIIETGIIARSRSFRGRWPGVDWQYTPTLL